MAALESSPALFNPAQNFARKIIDRALSIIFRAKFCAGLKRAGLLSNAAIPVWKKNWVVHSQHAGRGDKVLDYLGRYIFRIAISNSRLESIDNGMVRFRYRDN